MPFVYKLTNKSNYKIYFGYRKTLHKNHLIQKLKNEIESGYFNKELQKDLETMGRNFNSLFEVEIIYESNSVMKTIQEMKHLIIVNETYKSHKGYNVANLETVDQNEILDSFSRLGDIELASKELGVKTSIVKNVLIKNKIKYYSDPKRKTLGVEFIEIISGEKFTFESRSKAVNWLIENKITESSNRDNVYKTLRRVLSKKRKTSWGYRIRNLD